MAFPIRRPRRLRRFPRLRQMVRETSLSVQDVIHPLFVREGSGEKRAIGSMPRCFQMSVDVLVDEAKRSEDLGVPGILLFGIPDEKDEKGSGAYAEDGIVQRAVAAIKQKAPELIVVTDVCLCEYTSHGHCGVLEGREVDNDRTIDLLARTAVSHARAGADLVAPSDMMDGRVGRIRQALDADGLERTPILAYSAKFASAFYGPFREAAESTPQFGDRRQYQMDPANAREAMREVALDIEEGADIVMIKPALAYLDLIRAVREKHDVPVAAYNVSGEYSMVCAAAQAGWIDEKAAALEILTSIKRAGADIIMTYWAQDVAEWTG